jgi:serine/threonine-protein phosphatase 5
MSDAREEAVALKNKGNDAFRNQNWPAALEFYTKAIDAYDKDPSFYTNRAQVRTFAATAHDCLLI